MCADLILRKRGALHAGEVGLFLDTEIFAEEFGTIKQGVDVSVKATQSRNPKQHRLFWALAGKIAESGVLGDCDAREVVDFLLLKCKHVRYVTNQHKGGVETTPVVKSIRWAAMDQTAFDRLFQRALYIVTSEILPDMPAGELRAEVEKMAGVSTPEPEPAKPVRQRRVRAEPKSVSVIPADEPVIGDVSHSPALPASEGRTDDAGTVSADVDPPAPATSAPPAPSVPAAQVDGEGPAPISTPTNLATWQTWCRSWLDALCTDSAATDVDVLTRWANETKLRNACGITAEDRQQLFAYMNKIVEKKRETQVKSTS